MSAMDVGTWDRDALIGKRVIVRREVTAVAPTAEWTGNRVWEGTVTDGNTEPVRHGTALTAGVSVLTSREHTWLAIGDWVDGPRRWVTTLEIVGR